VIYFILAKENEKSEILKYTEAVVNKKVKNKIPSTLLLSFYFLYHYLSKAFLLKDFPKKFSIFRFRNFNHEKQKKIDSKNVSALKFITIWQR
jgi:hypothetical protein